MSELMYHECMCKIAAAALVHYQADEHDREFGRWWGALHYHVREIEQRRGG